MARSVWSLSVACWAASTGRLFVAGTRAAAGFVWAANAGSENANAQNEIMVAIFLTASAPVIQDRVRAAEESGGDPWTFVSFGLPSRKSESLARRPKPAPNRIRRRSSR